jgi:SPP1 gp7 family putative phage head morphogenesis protein
MIDAYTKVVQKLEPEVMRLMDRIDAARARGATVGPGLAFQGGRMDALLTQARAELTRFQGQAVGIVSTAQETALQRVPADVTALTLAALGDAPAAAQAVLRNSWSHLPSNVIEEFVGRTAAGSPLSGVFRSLGTEVGAGLETAIIGGLAAGSHPRVIAAEVRNEFGTGLNRALLITRTETLNAYREATRREYQANADVVGGWTWHSALGPRTCPACWVMHGSKHSNEERLDGHPRCRCSMLPLTPSWEELGFVGLPDTRPVVPRGIDLFEQASDEVQLSVLGAKGFAAYQSGEVKLVDFLARTDSPTWGTTRYARSVLAIREGRGGVQLGESALGGNFVPVFLPTPEPIPLVAITAPAPELPAVMAGEEAADAIIALNLQSIGDIQRAREALNDAETELFLAVKRSERFEREGDLKRAQQVRDTMDALKTKQTDLNANLKALSSTRIQRLRDFLSVDDPINVTVRFTGRIMGGRERIEQGVAEFEKMVSQQARPSRLDVRVTNHPKRSQFTAYDNTVAMDKQSGRSVVIHELGHWLEENNQQAHDAALAFLDRRTAGEANVRLDKLFPSNSLLSGYGPLEVTKPDQFIHPYVGKDYNRRATEVISMGLEKMWEDPAYFAEKDKDHFGFIWELVRGRYRK